MIKSANGWTASKNRAEIGIESFTVPGTKLKLACAKAVAPLLVGFAAEFHELIEPIDDAFIPPMPNCGHDELTLNELKRWECSNVEHFIGEVGDHQ